MGVDVKMCGIMTPEHGHAAVLAGADYIGLIFVPSRRRLRAPLPLLVAAHVAESFGGAGVTGD